MDKILGFFFCFTNVKIPESDNLCVPVINIKYLDYSILCGIQVYMLF